MYIIGLDIGTTGCKACVFDEHGAIAGYGFKEYPVLCIEPGMAEQDSAFVWSCTLEMLKHAIDQSGKANSITAIGVSVQGDAIIPLDKNGDPIGNAILGMDYRSEPNALWCTHFFGDKVLFDRTGMRPHPMNSAIKMLWLKENYPNRYKNAATLATYADFISGKLCGESVIDYSMASRTMCFDIHRKCWDTSLIIDLGLDPAKFSRTEQSGQIIGVLNKSIAQILGVSNSIAIVTGGHDQPCAALGAGVIGSGRAVLSSGTAEVLSCTYDDHVNRSVIFESYYPHYAHVVANQMFTFALNHSGGISFRWYRDTLGIPEKEQAIANEVDPYSAIIKAMPEEPSSVLFMPHFSGSPTPTCDFNSRAAIIGMSFSTTRHQIAKALLEGLSFEMLTNVNQLRTAGIEIEDIVVVGGGAKSPSWLQLRSDIIGLPIKTLANYEAACLGAAILATTAVKLYSTLNIAVTQMVHVCSSYIPDPGKKQFYSMRYNEYLQLYEGMKLQRREKSDKNYFT